MRGADVATGYPLAATLAETMIGAAAEKGRPMGNAGMHDRLADASTLLRDVVHPALDRQFGEFVRRAQAELEDRTAIRHRSLSRHFKKKLAMLHAQRSGILVQRAGRGECRRDPEGNPPEEPRHRANHED